MARLMPGMVVRHWKGGLYRIACFAEHTETGEKLVIYHPITDATKIYARPYDDFMGNAKFSLRFVEAK